MSVIGTPLLLGADDGGYQISRSVRLRSSASAYFNRTPASASNRKTWTWSGWVKRGVINTTSQYQAIFTGGTSTATASSLFYFGFWDTNGLRFSSGTAQLGITTAVFRDPSAWYHIVVAVDTTQATADNRIKVYVNGVQITMTVSNLAQNDDTGVNATTQHSLGQVVSSQYLDGYLTEVNFIDGQALTPSSFGETDTITGVWKPKRYTGTYGTNGFYLNFSDNSNNTAATIGKDYSGNGNNWTPNNISVTAGATYDSMLDVPTPWGDRGNYAVVNPIPPSSAGGSWYTQNGNLSLVRNGGGFITGIATIGVTSGKWYWEVIPQNSGNQFTIGIAKDGYDWTTYLGSNASGWSYEGGSGVKYTNGSSSAYGATYTTNDVIGVAFDADAGTLTFYKNGTSQGQAYSGLTSGPYYPACGVSNLNTTAVFNFGQRPFAHTPPTGFKALNTQNLPDSTIKKGNQYFNVVLWTGDGSGSSRTISNVGFQPDFVWTKSRTETWQHLLYDAVRGAGNESELASSSTAAEGGVNANLYGYLSAFSSDGMTFTSGTDGTADQRGYYNKSGQTYVAWNWKESASAGFDIVTFTGTGAAQNIAHSLGVAPRMMIVKPRSTSGSWAVYHASIGAGNAVWLNLTDASASYPTVWNSTAPTSSQFTVGSFANNGTTFVAYLFAEVAGFSRFGSYTGNGSADGPFVFTGFRPRWIMFKRTDSTQNWAIIDTARDTTNVMNRRLFANLSDAEDQGIPNFIDVTANGFKCRDSNVSYNASGGTYIYAAFAENPFKNSLAR